MKLSNGQKEYLLELLSGEYLLPLEYRPYLKDAINRYSTHHYTDEELEFLAGLPQSLTADLYLSRSSSLSNFARRFALWLNVLEYNIYDDSSRTIAFLPNPDPSSSKKLLQIIDQDDKVQIVAVPPIQFKTQTRSNPAITTINDDRRLHTPSLACIWDYQQINELMESFLAFANQNPAKIPDNYSDYLDILESNLTRTKEIRSNWLTLRSNAQNFAQISPDYTFSQRSLGLITPSTLEFISLINSKTQSVNHTQYVPVVANPFIPQIRFFKKLKSNLKAPAPLAFPPKPQSMKAFKLPPFPFANNFSPLKAHNRYPSYQQTFNDRNNFQQNTAKDQQPHNDSPDQQVSSKENLSQIDLNCSSEKLQENTNATESLITYDKFIEPQA